MTQDDIRISKQFCKFCVRVLKNEAVNIEAELARQRKREKSLNELTNDEIIRLSVCDEYFAGEHIFNVLDKEIGRELGAIQQTISKRRLSSLLQLRKLLDEEGFE